MQYITDALVFLALLAIVLVTIRVCTPSIISSIKSIMTEWREGD